VQVFGLKSAADGGKNAVMTQVHFAPNEGLCPSGELSHQRKSFVPSGEL